MNMLWIKNTGGKKDAALTMLVISFFVSLALAVLGAIEEITFNGATLGFRALDPTFTTTIFGGLAALYFGRRWVDIQNGLYKTAAASKEDKLPEQPE